MQSGSWRVFATSSRYSGKTVSMNSGLMKSSAMTLSMAEALFVAIEIDAEGVELAFGLGEIGHRLIAAFLDEQGRQGLRHGEGRQDGRKQRRRLVGDDDPDLCRRHDRRDPAVGDGDDPGALFL